MKEEIFTRKIREDKTDKGNTASAGYNVTINFKASAEQKKYIEQKVKELNTNTSAYIRHRLFETESKDIVLPKGDEILVELAGIYNAMNDIKDYFESREAITPPAEIAAALGEFTAKLDEFEESYQSISEKISFLFSMIDVIKESADADDSDDCYEEDIIEDFTDDTTNQNRGDT